MVALPETTSATIDAIEAAVVADKSREPVRTYIGASVIGKPCERHLWYVFRWAHAPEEFSGRMYRLFDTGHVEEDRMTNWLWQAGVKVDVVDPDTGEQWAVEAVDGHFRGHLDGIATGIIEAPKTPHLVECKTHNAKSFAQLVKHGVAIAKPEHVAQMQVYMHLRGLTRAFYMAKNKDTDELYAERIEYDPAHAMTLLAKAERIVHADQVPQRVSDDPGYYLCKSFKCPSYDICHSGQFALRNCRTCLHAQPINDGKWRCNRHERDLSVEDQKAGCPNHLYLPSLVPGEQTDADEARETVTYAMPDGTEWIDGEKNAGRAA